MYRDKNTEDTAADPSRRSPSLSSPGARLPMKANTHAEMSNMASMMLTTRMTTLHVCGLIFDTLQQEVDQGKRHIRDFSSPPPHFKYSSPLTVD